MGESRERVPVDPGRAHSSRRRAACQAKMTVLRRLAARGQLSSSSPITLRSVGLHNCVRLRPCRILPIMLLAPCRVPAAQGAPGRYSARTFAAERVIDALILDGTLEDAVWKAAALASRLGVRRAPRPQRATGAAGRPQLARRFPQLGWRWPGPLPHPRRPERHPIYDTHRTQVGLGELTIPD